MLAIVCDFVTAETRYSTRIIVKKRGVTVEMQVSIATQNWDHN